MTRTSLSHHTNFAQPPLAKKRDFFYSKEKSKIFSLKASCANINYKDPFAWAISIYADLPKPIKRVFDYLRKLETCKRTKGYIFATDETIAKRLGYKDKKTVEKYIKYLVELGLLWRHRYYPPRAACKGSKRFMCTFLNLDKFRVKQIGKFRKFGVLHKNCIESFEKYVQFTKDQSNNFLKEEMEEVQAEIDANEIRNEINYQREKNDQNLYGELSSQIHHSLHENAGSITKLSLRDINDNTIYNNSSKYQKIDDDPLIARYHGMAHNSIISPRREMELAIDHMCLTQPQFMGKKDKMKENFLKAWSLKYDTGLKFKKTPLHLAAHATIHGYDLKYGEKQEKKPQDYKKLLKHLRWDETGYPPDPFAKKSEQYSLCKSLALELSAEHAVSLEKMGISINGYGIEYLSETSHIKVPYTDPKIFKELVLRSYNYGYVEIKNFLLKKLRGNIFNSL